MNLRLVGGIETTQLRAGKAAGNLSEIAANRKRHFTTACSTTDSGGDSQASGIWYLVSVVRCQWSGVRGSVARAGVGRAGSGGVGGLK